VIYQEASAVKKITMGINDLAVQNKPFRWRTFQALLRSPARLAVMGFACLIAAGTAILMLPSATNGTELGFINALFTATSAACVTGLVVVDTGTKLSLFGQCTVLVLIQVGGLGIMTLSTLLILMVGRRPGLANQRLVFDSFTQGGEKSLKSILGHVVLFTGVIELIGAIVLFIKFSSSYGMVESIYSAIFHSISAFCNAGFCLSLDSLTAYREDWLINAVFCFLIISGGIGFLVLAELKRKMPLGRRGLSRLSLHSKIVLTTSFFLIVFGSLLITTMEWRNTLSPLSVSGRFAAGVFQAVSARTAGFNTLSIGGMANETLFILMILMFIGASPGSCGGGIKTSTFASLIVLGISRLQGSSRPRVFYRSIARESIEKAVSLVMVSMAVVITATMMLLMSEIGDVSHTVSRGLFLELLFEVISAFGTVGLSTGITPGLSAAGKLILTLVMFVGRLGPLAVAVALSQRKEPAYYYAEENIMIG